MSKKHQLKSPLLIRYTDYTRANGYNYQGLSVRVMLSDLLHKKAGLYYALSATPNFCDIITPHYCFSMVTMCIPNRVRRRTVCPAILRHFI